MMPKIGKKAMMNHVLGIIIGIILVVVGFVTVFYIIGGLSPTLTTAANNISNSGLPLASLFTSSGVLLIIFMIAVFIALILLAFGLFKQGKRY